MAAISAGVSPAGQNLYMAIAKTINEVKQLLLECNQMNRLSNIGVPFDRLHGWTRT